MQAALAGSELDCLLLWKDENVRYLTGMRAQVINGKSALLNGVLLRGDAPPILLCSGGDYQRAQASMTWIVELHPIPILEARGLVRGFVDETLQPLLAEHGLAGARIGIDECSFMQVQELRRALRFRHLLAYGMIFMVPIAPIAIFGAVNSAYGGMVVTA